MTDINIPRTNSKDQIKYIDNIIAELQLEKEILLACNSVIDGCRIYSDGFEKYIYIMILIILIK